MLPFTSIHIHITEYILYSYVCVQRNCETMNSSSARWMPLGQSQEGDNNKPNWRASLISCRAEHFTIPGPHLTLSLFLSNPSVQWGELKLENSRKGEERKYFSVSVQHLPLEAAWGDGSGGGHGKKAPGHGHSPLPSWSAALWASGWSAASSCWFSPPQQFPFLMCPLGKLIPPAPRSSN